MVRDPEAHKKIWTEALGAQVTKTGTLELIKLPGIFLVLGRGDRAEGSEGDVLEGHRYEARVTTGAGAGAGRRARGASSGPAAAIQPSDRGVVGSFSRICSGA